MHLAIGSLPQHLCNIVARTKNHHLKVDYQGREVDHIVKISDPEIQQYSHFTQIYHLLEMCTGAILMQMSLILFHKYFDLNNVH